MKIVQSDDLESDMPNLPIHSGQQAQLSWLQSSDGDWCYFPDENNTNKDDVSAIDQDYIWLVSQTTAAHKVSGYRIANDTIEMFIKQLAGVNQVIVFGIPHEKKGNTLHVYVELNNAAIELSTLSNAINAKLAGCLGEFARADVIKFVEQFPTVNNKRIYRKILKSENITMNYAA